MSQPDPTPLLSTGGRALLVGALGLGLVVEGVLLAVTPLLILAGLGVIIEARLRDRPAIPPADREVKLVGFAMAFFALSGLAAWAYQGGAENQLSVLANRLQLLFFWPLFVLVRRIKLSESAAFAALLAFAALTGLASLVPFAADDANVYTSSNLTLLGTLLLVVVSAYGYQSRRPALLAAALSAALILGVVFGLDPGTYQIAPMTPRGPLDALAWMLLLAIPFMQFAPLWHHESPRVACLATAGTLIPAAYLAFALTGTDLDGGAYLSFYLVVMTLLAHLTWQAMEEALHRPRRQRLSVTLITYNEADNIGPCLESLAPIADEVIVLDSGSTDDTVAIARHYTGHVEVTDWPGFGIQKQRALERATGDWVLSIDADERITPYLAREINHVLGTEPDADAYKLPWAVTIYGKRLDFGRSARAPLRLFRREGARFTDAQVHETIVMPEGARIRTLRGRLTHYTHRDYGHALAKSAQYAWLGAQQRAQKGRRTRTLLYPTVRAITTFVQVYIIRLGFLDGPVGYLMAVIYAQSSFNTFAGLWTLRRQPHKRHDEL